jgi:hypothetical protein
MPDHDNGFGAAVAEIAVSLGLRLQLRIRAIGRNTTADNSRDCVWPTSWLSYSRLPGCICR